MPKTIKLKHDSITSFSIGGEQFDVNDKGAFEVPEEVAAKAHEVFGGFTIAGRTTTKAAPAEAPVESPTADEGQ